jgi:hypothetical protein
MALKLITHISIIFKVKILISDKITVLRLGGKFITLHFFTQAILEIKCQKK